MGESIRMVDYFYMESPDQPGEAARVLDQLRKAGVNLLVFSGFPVGRKAQLDFVPGTPLRRDPLGQATRREEGGDGSRRQLGAGLYGASPGVTTTSRRALPRTIPSVSGRAIGHSARK